MEDLFPPRQVTRGSNLNIWREITILSTQAASGERGGNPKKPTNNNATESTDDGIAPFITPAADGMCVELR